MAGIKIIDDDLDYAADMAEILRGEGHDVETRDQLEGAVEELSKAPPDLLILDVMFPGNQSGGFDLARAIRKEEKLARLPIILLTAINQKFPLDFSTRDIDHDWMPVQDFLEKPPPVPDLLQKIDELLAR